MFAKHSTRVLVGILVACLLLFNVRCSKADDTQDKNKALELRWTLVNKILELDIRRETTPQKKLSEAEEKQYQQTLVQLQDLKKQMKQNGW